MRRSSWKITLGYFIVVIISFVIIVNYKTNYNWRYKDLIQELTDVPNKEFIKSTNFKKWKSTPSTFFDITISDESLSDDEIYQMGYDIAEKIDRFIYPGMKQSLSINPLSIYMSLYSPSSGRRISGTRYTKYKDVKVSNVFHYEWFYTKYPNGGKEIRVTYPDSKGE